MGFGEKLKRAIQRIKGKLIVSAILWLVLVIVFVAPLGIAFFDANQPNVNFTEIFFTSFGKNVVNPLSSIGKYRRIFLECTLEIHNNLFYIGYIWNSKSISKT